MSKKEKGEIIIDRKRVRTLTEHPHIEGYIELKEKKIMTDS